MKIWPASGIFLREDDTFVGVFAFVDLQRGRAAQRAGLELLADRVRGTPTAFPFRAGFTRRAPGAVGLSGPPVVDSIVKSAVGNGRAQKEQ